eukprot:2284-Alexandrium_andersonii.AAC.1
MLRAALVSILIAVSSIDSSSSNVHGSGYARQRSTGPTPTLPSPPQEHSSKNFRAGLPVARFRMSTSSVAARDGEE